MDRKYELLKDETVDFYGKKLYRIRATENFNGVTEGEKGGYIESVDNLTDSAWVTGSAKVCGNAEVYGCAQVGSSATVCGNARVTGAARIGYAAAVYGSACVTGNARVGGNSEYSQEYKLAIELAKVKIKVEEADK